MHPQLPRELVSTIISQVTDNSTLLSLCLAAKATYREGSAQLYHSIDETGLQYGALRRQIKLLETLASNPYLSSLVHSYSIWSIAPRVAPEHIPDFQARAGRPTEWEHPEERFWHLLPLALNLMVNLKQLRFRERTGQPSADWLFANVTFQLKRLEWGSQREGAGMANFLVRQHHLEHLCILDGLLCPLAPSACVSVRSLKGDLTTLKRFLPGRPAITHLEWVLGHTENPAGLVRSPTLLPELGRITHLIIGGNSMRQNLAQYLVGCFHSLVALHLLSLKKGEEAIIFSATKLQTLVITTMPFLGSERGATPDALFTSLLVGSQSLHNLFIGFRPADLSPFKISPYFYRAWGSLSPGQPPHAPVQLSWNQIGWPVFADFCELVNKGGSIGPDWTVEPDSTTLGAG